MTNNTKERQSSLSSDKLLAILECIAQNRAPMRLQDIATQSTMTQSTVLRYLRTLQNANYIYQDEDTLRYGLTWKLCGLTNNLDSNLGLRNIATPFVNHLANTLQMGVCLVVGKGNQSIYLDCIDHPKPQYTPLQYIGKHAPLHATASGKILLSTFTDAELDLYVKETGLKRYTEYTICEQKELGEELEKVREYGYGIDDEECELGLKCISYPIYSYSQKIYAAISVFGNAVEMKEDLFMKNLHTELKSAAEKISSRLGYSKENTI